MSDFELEIKKEFIQEALLNLEEAEGSFMELESAPDPAPLLDQIFRLAHNLKGGSRAVGFGDVAEFTHQLENLVLSIQKGKVSLSSPLITTLLRANDRLVEMLTGLKGNLDARYQNADILADIQAWLDGKVAAESPAPEAAPIMETPSVPETDPSAPLISLDAALPVVPTATDFFDAPPPVETPVATTPPPPAAPALASAPPPANPKGGDKEKEDEVVRVNLSKIELLNNHVGELIVLQSVIQQQALESDPVLIASIRQMMKLSKDIQALSMSLRMLPVKPLVQKLQRVVRDTAQALDKDVQLQLSGEQLDIDKTVLDKIADPLIHILRNAVDHGLENKADRLQSQKASLGIVHLSFANEGNHLVVEVVDDGKGINPAVIRRIALEKKLITETQALTDKQLIHLIFHPGFSTKTETSEISGRGVGMDVVKTNVEKIGGQVEIQSVIGKGSTFRIQIPLSLAVIEGLVITSEKNRYVVPLSQVQETLNLKNLSVHANKLGIGSCFELRGTVVPIFGLEELLGSSGPKMDASGTALLFNVQGQLIAIAISDIVRAQQIVIKPLGNGLYPQRGWVGSCVLGDGLPTLILSPVDLLEGRVQASGPSSSEIRRSA